jgi:hypothetical protein
MSKYLEFQEIKSEYFNSDGELYGGFTGCSPVKNIAELMDETITEIAEAVKLLIHQIEMCDYVDKNGYNLQNNKTFNHLKQLML